MSVIIGWQCDSVWNFAILFMQMMILLWSPESCFKDVGVLKAFQMIGEWKENPNGMILIYAQKHLTAEKRYSTYSFCTCVQRGCWKLVLTRHFGLNAERTQLRYPINPSPEKRQEQKAADLLDNQAAVKKMKRQVDEERLAFARFGKSGSLNCLGGNFQDVVLSLENLGIWSYMIRCDP